jgi:hypothetical protein
VIVTARQRARYVVDASLLRIGREAGSAGPELRCEVTLFVSDSDSGALHAVLSGRGGTRDADALHDATHTVLSAAVRSAVRPLGETLRHLD